MKVEKEEKEKKEQGREDSERREKSEKREKRREEEWRKAGREAAAREKARRRRTSEGEIGTERREETWLEPDLYSTLHTLFSSKVRYRVSFAFSLSTFGFFSSFLFFFLYFLSEYFLDKGVSIQKYRIRMIICCFSFCFLLFNLTKGCYRFLTRILYHHH